MKKKLFQFFCVVLITSIVGVSVVFFYGLNEHAGSEKSVFASKERLLAEPNDIESSKFQKRLGAIDTSLNTKKMPNDQGDLRAKNKIEKLSLLIDEKNSKFSGLAEQYDDDLSNEELKGKLSRTLKLDNEYKAYVLEKYKLEKALNVGK